MKSRLKSREWLDVWKSIGSLGISFKHVWWLYHHVSCRMRMFSAYQWDWRTNFDFRHCVPPWSKRERQYYIYSWTVDNAAPKNLGEKRQKSYRQSYLLHLDISYSFTVHGCVVSIIRSAFSSFPIEMSRVSCLQNNLRLILERSSRINPEVGHHRFDWFTPRNAP